MLARAMAAGRRGGLAIAVALSLVACGGSGKPAAKPGPDAPRLARDLEPTEVIPADLDLVVRLDIGRLRAGVGTLAADEITKQAIRGGVDPELASTLSCAEVIWIAARAAELDTGDRVIVVEGKSCMPELSRGKWETVKAGNARVRIFDRTGTAARAGTARIMNLGNRATVFVSPVELDSVRRVIDDGPDAARGNPRAEGLVSLDVRPRPLSPGLAKKYPSIAAVLSGIERLRGSAVLVDDGLRISAEILAKTPPAATKAARFLDAVKDSLKEGKFSDAVSGAKVEVVEKTVQVKATVPTKVLLGAMGKGG